MIKSGVFGMGIRCILEGADVTFIMLLYDVGGDVSGWNVMITI